MITGLGVGAPWQNAANDAGYYERVLGTLRPAWWVDWLFGQVEYIYPPYLPMAWAMRMDAAANRALTASWYGPRLWLCGNEPERADQSNTLPAEAADFSRWWTDNASGTWAGPGVLLGLDPAYQWLDAYLAAGGRVPDAWAVHSYGWTPDQWDGNLMPFLRWMERRKAVRPVIVSECASWDQSLPAQIAIMDRVALALRDGNIVAACWYASKDPFGAFRGADLLDAAGKLTMLGEHYMHVASAEPAPQPAGNVVHLPFLSREGV